MNHRATIVLLVLVVLCSGVCASAFAEAKQSAIQKMATIMHRLKHFPSPQGKETLKQIVNDNTTNERQKTIATSMINLNHRALTKDKVKLKKIMEDGNASQVERDLASILYQFDHRPTKADKARLQDMMR